MVDGRADQERRRLRPDGQGAVRALIRRGLAQIGRPASPGRGAGCGGVPRRGRGRGGRGRTRAGDGQVAGSRHEDARAGFAGAGPAPDAEAIHEWCAVPVDETVMIRRQPDRPRRAAGAQAGHRGRACGPQSACRPGRSPKGPGQAAGPRFGILSLIDADLLGSHAGASAPWNPASTRVRRRGGPRGGGVHRSGRATGGMRQPISRRSESPNVRGFASGRPAPSCRYRKLKRPRPQPRCSSPGSSGSTQPDTQAGVPRRHHVEVRNSRRVPRLLDRRRPCRSPPPPGWMPTPGRAAIVDLAQGSSVARHSSSSSCTVLPVSCRKRSSS